MGAVLVSEVGLKLMSTSHPRWLFILIFQCVTLNLNSKAFILFTLLNSKSSKIVKVSFNSFITGFMAESLTKNEKTFRNLLNVQRLSILHMWQRGVESDDTQLNLKFS